MNSALLHGTFNIFRVSGDVLHAVGLLFLLHRLIWLKSASAISLKAQIMYLLVFVTRYLDLLVPGGYIYNRVFKIYYILSTAIIVFLLWRSGHAPGWKSTYNREKDTFVATFIAIPSFVLAYALTPSGALEGSLHWIDVLQILWTFSIYMEAFVMLPQYIMFYRMTVERPDLYAFLIVFCLGGYRVLYMINWIMKFKMKGAYVSRYHVVSAIGGIGNVIFFLDFLLHRFYSVSLLSAIVRRIDGGANAVAKEMFQMAVVGASSNVNVDVDSEKAEEQLLESQPSERTEPQPSESAEPRG
ncbi:hypothetical protein AAMO2058_001724700 [Amorphochlora amoebiformis]